MPARRADGEGTEPCFLDAVDNLGLPFILPAEPMLGVA